MSDENNKDEKSLLRPHVIDGIQELDNNLPVWWVSLFVFTVFFAIYYLLAFHVYDFSSLESEFDYAAKQKEELLLKQKEELAKAAAAGKSLKEDAELVAAGKPLYVANCAPCHGNEGQGLVGPNLTDKHWLHGGSDEDVIKSIGKGIPLKGMVAWEPILGPKKVRELSAYVLSLGGTNPPNPKEPQGEIYEP